MEIFTIGSVVEQSTAMAGGAGGIAAQLQQVLDDAPMAALGSQVQCMRPIQIHTGNACTRLGP